MKQYNILKNKHKNEIAFVCGAGTSFLNIINSPHFNLLDKHVVISVNSSIIAFDWSDYQDNKYWISNDSAVIQWDYWQKVLKSKCNRIIRDSWEKYYKQIPDDFYVFSPRKNDIIINDENRLVGVSSVPTAIDLAIQLGCKKIFLLGVDHYSLDGKTHFWEFFPKDKQPRTKGYKASEQMQNKIFRLNMNVYKELLRFSRDLNIDIINCNENSAVNYFNKINFEKIWQKNQVPS